MTEADVIAVPKVSASPMEAAPGGTARAAGASRGAIKRRGSGRWFRVLLTVIAVGFLTLFVVIPAGNVFAQAFRNGVGAYTAVFYPSAVDQGRLEAIRGRLKEIDAMPLSQRRKIREEQRTLQREESEMAAPAERARKNWSAVRMTMGIAAVVVPLNMLFGITAAWAVTKFHFKGRSLLVSVIDLPFSVSPVIAGLIFVLLFGAQGFLAAWSKSTRVVWLMPALKAAGCFLVALPVLWLTWMVVAAIARRLGLVDTINVASIATSGGASGRVLDYESPERSAHALLEKRRRVARRTWWGLLALLAAVFLIWQYTTQSTWSWAFLLPTDWRWPDPTSLYWRGFGGGRWWPVGAGEWREGVIFTPLAIVLASVFVTFPFVARSLIPLMETQGVEAEQAALTLGASGWYTFRRVTIPSIKWGLLYGAILCTARALGEFGAVSVVSGHLDSNDTMPLRVEKLWQEYKTQPAFTVASLLAMLAVVTLVVKSFIEWKTRKDNEDDVAAPTAVAQPKG